MLVRKHSPDTAAPDLLLSLTPDQCSSPGVRAAEGGGGHRKPQERQFPALGLVCTEAEAEVVLPFCLGGAEKNGLISS